MSLLLPRRELLATQIAVDAVMTDALQILSQICDRVIDRTAQQILAVVQFDEARASSLELLLRKS